MIKAAKYYAVVVAVAVTGFTGVAFATGDRAKGPCKPALEACQAAGKTKREAWHCVKEFQSKGSVEGVDFSKVTPEQQKACETVKLSRGRKEK